MHYHSTRNPALTATGPQAILQGLAPDGGLYVPQTLPRLSWESCLEGSALDTATALVQAFLPDLPDMNQLIRQSYTGKFQAEDLTPTVSVGPFSLLELYHGPTAAFKDVALTLLPQMLTAAKAQLGEQKPVLICTATSGDTGKAALEGFRDVPGVGICVFYPAGGVSQVQRAQMVTQEGNNVSVCAIRGDFDDAQTGVKEIFSACQGKDLPVILSSANSINIGRLIPQLTYYFRAYRDLVQTGQILPGEPVNFSVPTGNFGNILAGYLAKALGLPVGRLICASNANNVLTEFLRTGTYDRRRPLQKTLSPSMDILVSSNLERLLYFSSHNTALVASLMAQLNTQGHYTIPSAMQAALTRDFWAACCDDRRALETIGRLWQTHHYLCDPHTACAWVAAEDYVNRTADDRPMVVLSTASPYKFPAAVLAALGCDSAGSEFTQMTHLQEYTGVPIPRNLASLQGKPERHTDLIGKEAMLAYVLDLAESHF